MRPLDVIADSDRLDNLIDRRISPDDQMFNGNEDRYFGVGLDAITKIATVQAMAGVAEPRSVLDFACGHGRVGRYFRAAYPEAELTGADVMERALPFYGSTFGAKTIQTTPEMEELQLGRSFDLIWSGSLMTHLPEGPAHEMLALFDRHLEEDGIAVFTTHGRFVASKWKTGEWPYRMTEERLRALSEQFERGEYSYGDYDHMVGYGISMNPFTWIMSELEKFPQLRLVAFTERGWDDHQDIVGIQRRPVA